MVQRNHSMLTQPKWEEHSIWTVPHQWNSIGNVQPLLLIVQPAWKVDVNWLKPASCLWPLWVPHYTSSCKMHGGIDTTWKWRPFLRVAKWLSSFRGWSASDDGGTKALSRQRLRASGYALQKGGCTTAILVVITSRLIGVLGDRAKPSKLWPLFTPFKQEPPPPALTS